MKCARYLHTLGASFTTRIAPHYYSCLDIAAQKGHLQIYSWICETQKSATVSHYKIPVTHYDLPKIPFPLETYTFEETWGTYMPCDVGVFRRTLSYLTPELIAHIYEVDYTTRCPVCIAVNANQVEIVEYQLGCYPLPSGDVLSFLFYLACYRGYDTLAVLLLQKGLTLRSPESEYCKWDGYGIAHAAAAGNLETVKLLYAYGVGSSEPEHNGFVLHVAAVAGHLHIVEYLLCDRAFDLQMRDTKNNTAMMRLLNGCTSELTSKQWSMFVFLCSQMVLTSNANTSALETRDYAGGHTALFIAAKRDQLKVVRYLVEVCLVSTRAVDKIERNILQYAISCRHLDVALYLLQLGSVDINHVAKHGTALHDTAHARDLETMRFVAETCGANVEAIDLGGNTAAHTLAEHTNGSFYCLEYLLKAKPALVDTRNYSHETLLHTAASAGNASAVSLVEKMFPHSFARILQQTSQNIDGTESHGVLWYAVCANSNDVFAVLINYAYRHQVRIGDKRPCLVETFTRAGVEDAQDECLALIEANDTMTTALLLPTTGCFYAPDTVDTLASTPHHTWIHKRLHTAKHVRRLVRDSDVQRNNSVALTFSRLLPTDVMRHILSYDNEPMWEKITLAIGTRNNGPSKD